MESGCCEYRRGEPFFLLIFRETELKRECLVPLEMEGMAHFGGIVANEDTWKKQVVDILKGALHNGWVKELEIDGFSFDHTRRVEWTHGRILRIEDEH